jgi:transcription termination/antitermination protein NusG
VEGEVMARITKLSEEILFEPGAVVRVTDGPFNNFKAVVQSVNYAQRKARVAVQMLGRSTPVELDFSQFVSVGRVPAA